MRRNHSQSQRAFSLVELSIVLVILGLLVGGVLAGKSLIRSAQLRAIPKEHSLILSSINGFQTRFMALPGDMPNATAFWPWPLASNGNGDGLINGLQEPYKLWNHLNNAGYIGKSFYPLGWDVFAPNYCTESVRSHCLASKVQNHAWWDARRYSSPIAGNAQYFFAGDYGGNLRIDARAGNISATRVGVMTPAEIYLLDQKLDDGKPARGKMVIYSPISGCTNTSDPNNMDAEYLTTDSSKDCNPYFRNQF